MTNLNAADDKVRSLIKCQGKEKLINLVWKLHIDKLRSMHSFLHLDRSYDFVLVRVYIRVYEWAKHWRVWKDNNKIGVILRSLVILQQSRYKPQDT